MKIKLEELEEEEKEALFRVLGEFDLDAEREKQKPRRNFFIPKLQKPIIPTDGAPEIVLVQDKKPPSDAFTVVEESGCIKVGNKYCLSIAIKSFGRVIPAGCFSRIAELPIELTVSMHVETTRSDKTVKEIDKNLVKLDTDIYIDSKVGKDVSGLHARKEDLQTLLIRLQRNEDKIFRISLVLTICADSREELELEKELVYSTLSSLNLVYEPLSFRMKQGFTLTQQNSIPKITLHTEALSMLLPFVTQSFTARPNGAPLGVTGKEGLLVAFRLLNYKNPHIAILGETGSGKTTAVLVYALRSYSLGVKIIIIDPKGEYAKAVKAFGGRVVRYGEGEPAEFLDNDLVCFDAFHVPESSKDAWMYGVLKAVWDKARGDREERILVMDEAHRLLFNPIHSELLRTVIKESRSFKLCCAILSQNVYDFLESEKAGRQVLGNTACKLLMGLDDSEIPSARELFNLTEEEENFIRTAPVGKGLFISPESRIPIEVIVTPKELELIKAGTEDHDEPGVEEVLQEQKLESIYEVGKLSPQQISELLKEGYRKVRESNINGVPTYYLIDSERAKGVSSDAFVAIELLAVELRKKLSDFRVDYKNYPNFEFLANNKKVAVVVHLKGWLSKEKLKAIKCDEFLLITNASFKKAFPEFKVFTRKEFVVWLEGL